MAAAKPPTYIPSVRARRLARSLREYREQADLGVGDAARRLGWSQGKVSHIESCRNKPDIIDVELMLDLYGVGTPQREAMVTLAREAQQRGWWTEFPDVFNGPYVALEDAAAEINEWAPLGIPGLLQTPDYARAIMTHSSPDAPDEGDIERRLRARAARQTILTRKQGAPTLSVVLDELTLYRSTGGTAVMRAQLDRLIMEARRDNITIQVLPRDTATYDGLNGPLIVMRFAELADPDVAYVEGFHGAAYLEGPQQVARCRVAFERLRGAALDPQESAALIAAAAHKVIEVPSNAHPA